MDSSSVMHRWCNKDFGRNNTLTASRSCHSEGRNYFSYSTVFGQWVDLEKNVVLVYNGSTTPTSSRYRLWKGLFPKDVHVFPYDDGGHGYYHGCSLVSGGYYCNFKDEYFKQVHRIKLLDYYAGVMYNRFANITTSKSKGSEIVEFDMWGYFEELCSIYNDISVAKYLKTLKGRDKVVSSKRTMVKLLAAGERNVQVITDAMFGEGSYDKYMNNVAAKFKKAADRRAKMEALCERLGIGSPYVQYRGYKNLMPHDMSAADIRKLTAKERVELHFKALAYKEYKEHENERKEKRNENFRNAYKWIVGFEPKSRSWGGGYESDVHNNCVNKENGVVYECSGDYIYGFYWCKTSVSFEYDEFRNAEDKEQWIADFYAECKEVALNRKAIGILTRIKAHYEGRHYSEKRFIADDYLRENTTDAEYVICAEFIRKQDKHYADEEARRRAEEIARLKREEEERKDRVYREQVKQEQIDELSEHGIEGVREIWRRHYMSIEEVKRETYGMDGDLFSGGNVLLRLNLNKDKVETSKSIRIPVEVCKKMWKIVSKWHENPACFKSMQIDTKCSGKYTISSYENDILTAGCHKIAYTEMARMYYEIQGL